MITPDWQPHVEDLHRKVKLYRKRGDALQEAGQEEEAAKNYRNILEIVEEIIAILAPLQAQAATGLAEPQPPIKEEEKWVGELIEAYGLSGGMYRRLGKLEDSLKAYQEGAKLEKIYGSPSTYNRVNAVKLALLSGATSLASLRPAIDALESFLTQQLTEAQHLSDSAWSWADLGDCRALQGDVPGAERAYRTFVEKAGSQAPKTTLAMLREMDRALQRVGDPNEAAVAQVLAALETRLA